MWLARFSPTFPGFLSRNIGQLLLKFVSILNKQRSDNLPEKRIEPTLNPIVRGHGMRETA